MVNNDKVAKYPHNSVVPTPLEGEGGEVNLHGCQLQLRGSILKTRKEHNVFANPAI